MPTAGPRHPIAGSRAPTAGLSAGLGRAGRAAASVFAGTLGRWAAVICAAAACALLVGPTSASAQDFHQGWSDPRVLSPAGLGPAYSGLTGASVGLTSRTPRFGVEAGDFIIQPRLFVEGAYRSNFFRTDSRDSDPRGVFALHVRPGLAIFNPIFDKVAMSFGADADVFVPASGDDAVTDQTSVGGTARLAVALFPKGALTLVLHNEFQRSLWMRPTIRNNANRNRNRLGADLSFHPGGRAIDITLGYVYELQRFDDLSQLDTDQHGVRMMASWRFYPMTTAFLEATVDLREYSRELDTEALDRPGNYVPGTPVRAYVGLSGYLTERIAVLARVGYGNSLLERPPDDFSSIIGQLQLSYRFSERSIVHVGGARDFELRPLGGHMDFIRVYGSFTQRIGDLADLTADVAYEIRNYGEWEPFATDGTTPVATDPAREEAYFRAGLMLDFHLSRLFGATVGYRFEGIISDFAIVTDGLTSFVGYNDHRIFASVNLRY